jgi:hypothetical protein
MPTEAPVAPLSAMDSSFDAAIDAAPVDPRYQSAQPPQAQEPPAKESAPSKPVEAQKAEATSDAPKAQESAPDLDLSDGLGKLRKQAAKPQAAAPVEPDNTPTETPKTPKALRDAYELTKKENASLQAKIQELAKAKEEGTKAEVAKAQAELTAKLEQLQKKYEDNETRLRYVDYERSDEHIEKYQKPLDDAWSRAGTELRGYKAQMPDGTTRPLEGKDLVELVTMDPGEAHEKAEQMFGSARGSYVMSFVREIRQSNRAKNEAIEDWKKRGSEYQAEQTRTREETMQFAIKNYESRQEQLRKDAPDLFDFNAENPIGKEAKEYVESREKLNALAFRGIGLKEGVTPQERAQIMSKAQAEVAAASRILPFHILRADKAEERVKELEAKIAKLQGTEPRPGGKASVNGGSKAAGPKSFSDLIDEAPAYVR